MTTCAHHRWPDAVLERFDARPMPRRRGYWTARCPVRDHRSARLSLWLGKGGSPLLLGCWAGCPKPEILARKGLKMSDLFPPQTEGAYGRANYAGPTPRRIVETYAYRDEVGGLLYEVVRYEPKDFRQRRPDGGHWAWNLQGVRLVLYRLPELLASSPASPVFVVEGERKCDALRTLLGLVATTGCGGCGMGWQPGYSVALAGRRVVVLPDNNAAGVRHALHVAGSLMVHGAASLRVVPLPGLAEGEDVHDALKKGMTRRELLEVVRQFPEWTARC